MQRIGAMMFISGRKSRALIKYMSCVRLMRLSGQICLSLLKYP